MVWVLAIAAVSVAIAGVAVALELDNPGHGANVATRGEHSGRPAPLHPRPAPPTTTPASVTTTTSAPTQPAVLLSANKGTATYQLTSPGASIEVTTTGPCWIEVKVGGAGGRTIFEGTLAAGGHSKVTGPAWIRLGDPPYAKVTVDGTPMTVPGATTAVPLNLQFTLG
jgi:hypothetical protein